MPKYTLEKIKTKIIELCNMRGCNNEETIAYCFQIIDNYLSYKGSTLEVLFSCLNVGIDNHSWLLAWNLLTEEIDKLSGEYEANQEKEKNEGETILLDYEPLDLGERILSEKELQNLKVNLGVIDAFGIFHTSERLGISPSKWPDHRSLARYLHLKEKIIQYYIRVGCICGKNDGLLCAESLCYGDYNSLKSFLLTEKMAIALYNSIMSKKNIRFSTFEEKLAFYGTEFGYYSTMYDVVPQIYDRQLYNNNMKVLSYTLGKRFDRKYFTDILQR